MALEKVTIEKTWLKRSESRDQIQDDIKGLRAIRKELVDIKGNQEFRDKVVKMQQILNSSIDSLLRFHAYYERVENLDTLRVILGELTREDGKR